MPLSNSTKTILSITISTSIESHVIAVRNRFTDSESADDGRLSRGCDGRGDNRFSRSTKERLVTHYHRIYPRTLVKVRETLCRGWGSRQGKLMLIRYYVKPRLGWGLFRFSSTYTGRAKRPLDYGPRFAHCTQQCSSLTPFDMCEKTSVICPRDQIFRRVDMDASGETTMGSDFTNDSNCY